MQNFQVIIFDQKNQGREPMGTADEIPVAPAGSTIFLSNGRRAVVKEVQYHYDDKKIYMIV